MTTHVLNFLEALSPHYAKRHESDEALREWVKGWIRSLSGYDAWVLERAAMRIIDTRDERSFPLIPEVKKVCHEIIREDRLEKPELKVAHSEQNGDPYALADALINCEIGRRAARDETCWVLALHDFCRDNRRLPLDGEIPKLKRVAAEFETNYRLCVRGEAGPNSKLVEALGASMIRRREKMRARLLQRETT